jgi:hypothetical protein
MVGLAVEFSKHQCLFRGICGAHAAENWCGGTHSGVTTGIEVGRIRHVRLSRRDVWSKCRYGKSEPVNRVQRDRRVDIEFDPPAHNTLKSIPPPWAPSSFNKSPADMFGPSLQRSVEALGLYKKGEWIEREVVRKTVPEQAKPTILRDIGELLTLLWTLVFEPEHILKMMNHLMNEHG